MAKSLVVKLIKDNALKPGDRMVDISGRTIEGSIVLDAFSVLIKEPGGYDLIIENVILGDETRVRLSDDVMEILRRSAL